MPNKVPQLGDLRYTETKNVVQKELEALGSTIDDDNLDVNEAQEYLKTKLKSGEVNLGRADVAICIQTILKDKKYYTGKLDGRYGSKTKTAVKALQKALGFKGRKIDGVFGPKTFAKYLGENAETYAAKSSLHLAYMKAQVDKPRVEQRKMASQVKAARAAAREKAAEAAKAEKSPTDPEIKTDDNPTDVKEPPVATPLPPTEEPEVKVATPLPPTEEPEVKVDTPPPPTEAGEETAVSKPNLNLLGKDPEDKDGAVTKALESYLKMDSTTEEEALNYLKDYVLSLTTQADVNNFMTIWQSTPQEFTNTNRFLFKHAVKNLIKFKFKEINIITLFIKDYHESFMKPAKIIDQETANALLTNALSFNGLNIGNTQFDLNDQAMFKDCLSLVEADKYLDMLKSELPEDTDKDIPYLQTLLTTIDKKHTQSIQYIKELIKSKEQAQDQILSNINLNNLRHDSKEEVLKVQNALKGASEEQVIKDIKGNLLGDYYTRLEPSVEYQISFYNNILKPLIKNKQNTHLHEGIDILLARIYERSSEKGLDLQIINHLLLTPNPTAILGVSKYYQSVRGKFKSNLKHYDDIGIRELEIDDEKKLIFYKENYGVIKIDSSFRITDCDQNTITLKNSTQQIVITLSDLSTKTTTATATKTP